MNCARPLAAVSGFIDTLRGHARDDEEAREHFLDIMSVEAARMRRLIDDLLSLTRIELNEHVPPETRDADSKASCAKRRAALRPLAASRRISQGECRRGEAALPIVGDRATN